jgi:hypothetical protein
MISIIKQTAKLCDSLVLGPVIDIPMEYCLVFGHATEKVNLGEKLLYIPEIFEMICEYLNAEDMAILVKVSRRLHETGTNKLYKNVCFHGQEQMTNLLKLLKIVNPRYHQPNEFYLFVSELFMGRDTEKTISDAFLSIKKRLVGPIKTRKPCDCSECLMNSRVADSFTPIKFIVPDLVGRDSHRFNRVVYGIVPKNTNGLYKLLKNTMAVPCLQIPHRNLKSWSIYKCRKHETFGPLIQSLSLTDVSKLLIKMNLHSSVIRNLFEKTINLNAVQISRCENVNNDCIRELAERSNSNLLRLALTELPFLTDLGLYYIGKNCPNLEYLNLTNCINISESGVKNILVMCPFLNTLILNREGYGNGFSINEKVVPYIAPYAISLKRLGISGCALGEKEILILIERCKTITSWIFNINQLGTRKIKVIKEKLLKWFGFKIVRLS